MPYPDQVLWIQKFPTKKMVLESNRVLENEDTNIFEVI
jgi:hypothetical protein